MNKQNKTPKGIKIITGLMFVTGLALILIGIGFSISAIIFMSFLLIASIGLWKMKKWGLFVSYFALSVLISITTIQAIRILILKEVPGVIGVDYLSEVIFWYVPPIFIAISILYYLWRKRRCFS